jgi:acylphosphatase
MAKGRVHLVIRGRVQGVFYRASAQEKATELKLTGWVRNRPDKTVEIVAEGEREDIDALIEWCYVGPQDAYVTGADVNWEPYTGEFREFSVKYRER